MIFLRIARWLLPYAFWLLVGLFVIGALPFELAVAVLSGLWWLFTLPLVALPEPLGSLVLAIVLALLGVAFVHDAVLWEDYEVAEAKAREVYQRRKASFGNYSEGRYGFLLADIRPLPVPLAAKGALGLWDWQPPESRAW
jgi:hypothetical protein